MSEKQLGAAPGEESDPEAGKKPGWFGRLRTLPGFRTAAIAFVLTVVLGIGSTAAFAYWSQSSTVRITGSTWSGLPPDTGLVTAQPALTARPGTPSNAACKALLSKEQMRLNKHTDTRFSWQGAAKATSYVVTIRSNLSGAYDQTQTVTDTAVQFSFERSESHENGDQKLANPPFYGRYTVRVMPMAGIVPGDPLYFTYQYEHQNSSICYENKIVTGASPLGNTTMNCALPAFTKDGYVESKFTWTSSAGATSYVVTMTAKNGSGYGGEQVVTGLNAAFRVMQPLPGSAPGKYDVRVQPMKGTVAGDPRYVTYRLGQNDHGCD